MSSSRKKTSFVPRIVFRAAVVGAGVVPTCVTAALGSLEMACVAIQAFDGGLDADAATPSESGVADAFGVADIGFDDVGHKDAPVGVALDAFGGG
jgi:hypothetical protein